jgi:hypothetical protein
VATEPELGLTLLVPPRRHAVEQGVVAHQDLEAAGVRRVRLVDGCRLRARTRSGPAPPTGSRRDPSRT